MNSWPGLPPAATSSCDSEPMRKILHVLTRENDSVACELISRQRAQPDCELETVDLTTGQPDYEDLLQRVFAADSVAVW